ncbi:MAG: class I adenylate-forming enzyme family protein, partial [Caulobacteraceae bacterium]
MHYKELKTAWGELTAPGAPFEIKTIEVRGAPMRTYKNAPASVRDLWRSSAAFAERDYLVFEVERLSFREAHERVASLAAWLAGAGVGKGDRVAIAMRNFPEWLLVYWAAIEIGAAAVGMNAWWTAEEMAYVLSDCAPKVLFADAERLARLAERPAMAEGMRLVAVRADPSPGAHRGALAFAEATAEPGLPNADPIDPPIDPDDDACIFYTSGTTGFPKGARLTHRGCVSNLMSMMFSGQVQALATSRATGVPIDPAAAPVPAGLITTPLFHVTANNCAAYALTAAGGKMVLMRKWDPGEALRLIAAERITAMSGVPVMAREILQHPDFSKSDT